MAICVLLLAVIGLLLPVIILLFAYARIIHCLWFRKDIGPFQKIVLQSRRSVTITLGIVSAVFIVCRTPYLLVFLINCVNRSGFNSMKYNLVALFCTLSTCLNPLIYSFRSPQFKKNFRAMCRERAVISPHVCQGNLRDSQVAVVQELAFRMVHLHASAITDQGSTECVRKHAFGPATR